MKIKTSSKNYSDIMKMEKEKHMPPCKPFGPLRKLMKWLADMELREVNFSYKKEGMERVGKDEPCLILMNHSSFIDLKICMSIFADRPFNIVCTSDGFVGRRRLMRRIGCIPTTKFVTDIQLLKDMKYAVEKLHTSVLMYPEASYSFDGTATPLPEGVGKCIKLLNVPVVMVKTQGAFLRDPLYNNLQTRKVDVSADVLCLFSKEETEKMSSEEINERLRQEFSFDNFRWQQENKISVDEEFRADFLNRVLYKCPHCFCEGKTIGQGTVLKCQECGHEYELTEYGELIEKNGDTKFSHVPDWYRWQRECVKEEVLEGSYRLEVPVNIRVLKDYKSIYEVGEGILTHSLEGFHLVGADGQIDYHQRPEASYSLYADYYWYELGDVICIGNNKILFYCFPKCQGDVVAKTRLATEELYKLSKARMG